MDERYMELFPDYFYTSYRIVCSDDSCIINNEDSKVMSHSFVSKDEAISYWNSLKI